MPPVSTTTEDKARRLPIFIFDSPRTSSQLLAQFFAKHQQLEGKPGVISSWIWPLSIVGQERLTPWMKISPKAIEADKSLQAELGKWYNERVNLDVDTTFTFENVQMRYQHSMQSVLQEGKIPLTREHRTCLLKQDLLLELLRTGSILNPPSNPTYIPNEIYATIQSPIILIRHPAKVIPSYYRSSQLKQKYAIDDEPVRAWTMQRLGRFFFESLSATNPIVIDGDDVMARPRELCDKLCEIWGISKDGVQFEWEEEKELSKSYPLADSYMRDIFYSTAIKTREIKDVDVEAEQVGWEEEFGKGVAIGIRKLVDEDLEDYEYLKSRKLQL